LSPRSKPASAVPLEEDESGLKCDSLFEMEIGLGAEAEMLERELVPSDHALSSRQSYAGSRDWLDGPYRHDSTEDGVVGDSLEVEIEAEIEPPKHNANWPWHDDKPTRVVPVADSRVCEWTESLSQLGRLDVEKLEKSSNEEDDWMGICTDRGFRLPKDGMQVQLQSTKLVDGRWVHCRMHVVRRGSHLAIKVVDRW